MMTDTLLGAALAVATLHAVPGRPPSVEATPHSRARATNVQPTLTRPTTALATLAGETLEHRAYRLTQDGPHDALILEAAAAWGLSPFVLRSLLFVESRLEARVENPRSGAIGLGQFTAGGRRAVTRLWALRGRSAPFTRAQALDPAAAIPAAAELLAHLQQRCGGLEPALAAYNTGRCRGRATSLVRVVLTHANRARTAAGLPPIPPGLPRRRPESGPNS